MNRPTLADVPELAEAIDALGDTAMHKAAAIGYSHSTLHLWLTEGLPKPILMLLDRPQLAAALAAAAARRDKTVISDTAS